MSDPTIPPFDQNRAHRWFAVEANNLAWDLLAISDRAPADTEQMIHAAHAAAFHWSHVGTAINTLRAEVLLTTAHCAAGHAEAAVRHAERGLAALPAAGGTATPFDIATVHAAAAAAFELASRTETADFHRVAARGQVGQFDDPEDRQVFDRFYPDIRLA